VVEPVAFVEMLHNDGVKVVEHSSRSIREEYTSGHIQRCELCSDVHARIDLSDIELTAYVHIIKCDECGHERVSIREVLTVMGEYEVRRTGHYLAKCSNDCGLNVPVETTPETLETVVECTPTDIEEIPLRIEGHHVSYEPEIKMPLCKSCHSDVHFTDQYEPFKPDMKRTEWDGG